MNKFTDREIDFTTMLYKVKKQSTGAIIAYYGIVKEQSADRKVSFIKITRKKGGKEELRIIEEQIKNKFDIEDIAIVRRTGKLKVGEIILVVFVSAVHRKEAFSACRFAIEKLKKMKKIVENES